MALSRKHFVDLADVVVEQHEDGDMTHGQTLLLIDNLTYMCRKHNSNFDYIKFHHYILNKLGLERFDVASHTKEVVDA